MEAIQTKFLPSTDTKGSRIKAWSTEGQVTIPYPHELHGQACHRLAAETLAAKLNRTGTPLPGGCLPNNNYCFIFDNSWAKD